MSLPIIIYLASFASPLKFVFCVLAVLSGVICLMFFGMAYDNNAYDNNEIQQTKDMFIRCAIISSFFTIMAILIPTTNTIYLMVGMGELHRIDATSEAAKARQVLNLGLDKMITKLQESN